MEYLFAVFKISESNTLLLFVKFRCDILASEQEGIAIDVCSFFDYDVFLNAACSKRIHKIRFFLSFVKDHLISQRSLDADSFISDSFYKFSRHSLMSSPALYCKNGYTVCAVSDLKQLIVCFILGKFRSEAILSADKCAVLFRKRGIRRLKYLCFFIKHMNRICICL